MTFDEDSVSQPPKTKIKNNKTIPNWLFLETNKGIPTSRAN